MNARSLFLAAILVTLGAPLAAAASSPDSTYLYAPLSSLQAIRSGDVHQAPAGDDAGAAVSYPLASYSATGSMKAVAGEQGNTARHEDSKETQYALSSYPSSDDRG